MKLSYGREMRGLLWQEVDSEDRSRKGEAVNQHQGRWVGRILNLSFGGRRCDSMKSSLSIQTARNAPMQSLGPQSNLEGRFMLG